jgi:hypothetical protein
MTTTASKNFVPGVALTTSSVNVYTSPANVTSVVKAASAANNGTTTIKLTVNVVRSSGAAATTNVAIAGIGIAPGLTYMCPELVNKVLGPGDFLSVKDDTGGVTSYIVDGVQIS